MPMQFIVKASRRCVETKNVTDKTYSSVVSRHYTKNVYKVFLNYCHIMQFKQQSIAHDQTQSSPSTAEARQLCHTQPTAISR